MTTKTEKRILAAARHDDDYWETAAKKMRKSKNFTQMFAERKAADAAARKKARKHGHR